MRAGAIQIDCATLPGKRCSRGTIDKFVRKHILFVAFAFYCALAICWVWILTFTPLSRAYPFVALALAITPMLGGWLFDEPINLRLGLGIAAIVFGLILVVG